MFKYIVNKQIECPPIHTLTYNHDHQHYLMVRDHQWMKYQHQWTPLTQPSSLSAINILQLLWLHDHIYLLYAQKKNALSLFLMDVEEQMNVTKQLQLKPIHKFIIHSETKLSYDRGSSTITCSQTTKRKGMYHLMVRQISTITFQQTIYTTKLKKDTAYYHVQNMKAIGYKTILSQQQLTHSRYTLYSQGSQPEDIQAETVTLSYQTLKLTQTNEIILIPSYLGCMGQISYWAMHSFDSIWIVGIHNADQKITSAQFHLPQPNIVCNCLGMKDMGIFVIYEHKGNIVLNIHSPNEEDKFSHMNSITLPNMEYVSTMKGKDRLIIVSGREGQTILTELQMISKNIIYGKMLDELHVAEGHLFDVMCEEICNILG